jgi:hypothetical protein
MDATARGRTHALFAQTMGYVATTGITFWLLATVRQADGAILAALAAAFLTVIVLAAVLAGHVYQSQRAAGARLRATVAVLSEPGPVTVNAFEPTAQVQAQAMWRLAEGPPLT